LRQRGHRFGDAAGGDRRHPRHPDGEHEQEHSDKLHDQLSLEHEVHASPFSEQTGLGSAPSLFAVIFAMSENYPPLGILLFLKNAAVGDPLAEEWEELRLAQDRQILELMKETFGLG
jgi:hypothetical protein